MSHQFIDEGAGPLRFLACYLEVLKEEDPVLHEKICAKQREIMKDIAPNSGDGHSTSQMIKDVLQEADKKRFYEVERKLESGDRPALSK